MRVFCRMSTCTFDTWGENGKMGGYLLVEEWSIFTLLY